MEDNTKRSIIEALIISSPDPLPVKKITDVVDDVTPSKVAKAISDLNNCYMEAGASFRIRQLAGGYQFYVVPEFAGYVQELFTRTRKLRLTRASLETLAIVAYRQPVTKADVEHIRGVASDGVLHNLLEKSLIAIKGRAKTVGKPLQYGTTNEFLKFFGLNSLADLPRMSEIEDLIKAQEPQNQTQLPFETEKPESTPEKLNIADGTFDPASREEDPQPEPEISEPEIEVVDEVPDEEVFPEPEPVVAGGNDSETGVIVDLDISHE